MVNLRLTRRAHQRRGFTVLELMVTVALIGILAGVAIPNFVSYQARARRSEAFTHLSGLARAQKSYQAENDIFLDSSTSPDGPTLPDPGDYGGLGVDKMPWDAKTASFYDQVGCGASERSTAPWLFTTEYYIEELNALLAHLGREREVGITLGSLRLSASRRLAS